MVRTKLRFDEFGQLGDGTSKASDMDQQIVPLSHSNIQSQQF